MEKAEYFDKNVITSMVRESLDDPGGKTFVILVYYDTEFSASGFVETPVLYYYDRYKFVITTDIPVIMKRVIQDEIVSCRKQLTKHYLKWLRRKNAVHAAWAIHFWERGDGDFEGRAYYVPEHRETVFYGSANLVKILSSVRGK